MNLLFWDGAGKSHINFQEQRDIAVGEFLSDPRKWFFQAQEFSAAMS